MLIQGRVLLPLCSLVVRDTEVLLGVLNNVLNYRYILVYPGKCLPNLNN